MIRYRIKGIDSNGKPMYWAKTGGWAGLESAGAYNIRYARAIIADQIIRNRHLDSDERIEASLEKVT